MLLRGHLGLHARDVGRHLEVALLGGPAEEGRQQVGDLVGAVDATMGVLDGDAGPPGEDVLEVQRRLVDRGVHHLHAQILRRRGQRLQQALVAVGVVQHVVDQRAVAVQQPANPVRVQPESASEVLALVDEREVTVRPEQRDAFGDRRRHPGGDEVVARVDGVGGHHTVGGVLAAGDRHESGRDGRDRVFPGQLRGLVVLPGQQRPEAGVDAFDVVVVELGDQDLVDAFEDVVDVGAGGGRMREVEVPVGVGGADDPVRLPRDDEQHRVGGAQDDRGLADDPVARHHDVHALGGPDLEVPALLGQCLHLVGPHARGVDHAVGTDLGHIAVLGVAHPDSEHPVGFAQKSGDLGRGPDDRTVIGRCAGDREAVPRVVDDGVVVPDPADERAALECRGHAQGTRSGDMTLSGNGLGAAHPVVEEDAGSDIRPLPHPLRERIQERQRLDQMWREEPERQLAFA